MTTDTTAQYKAVNPDVFNRNTEAARARKTGGGGDFWKPNVGKVGVAAKNVIRVLPPHVNMEDVFVEAKVHFSLGPAEDTAVLCLAPWGEPCAACTVVDQEFKDARRETDPEAATKLKEKAKKRAAKLRFFANVVDMQKPEGGVQVYAFGPDVEKRLRACFYDDDSEFRDVSHPVRGRDIMIMVSKKAGGKPGNEFNQYDEIRAKEKETPLADQDWLQALNDLTQYNKKPTAQEVQNALMGIKPGGNAGAQQAQAPAAAPQRPAVVTPPAQPRPVPGRTVTPPQAAVAAQETAKKPARTPVTDNGGADPYQRAKAAIVAAGFASPIDVTQEEIEKMTAEGRIPGCYTTQTDPSDANCQGCKLIIPCYSALHKIG